MHAEARSSPYSRPQYSRASTIPDPARRCSHSGPYPVVPTMSRPPRASGAGTARCRRRPTAGRPTRETRPPDRVAGTETRACARSPRPGSRLCSRTRTARTDRPSPGSRARTPAGRSDPLGKEAACHTPSCRPPGQPLTLPANLTVPVNFDPSLPGVVSTDDFSSDQGRSSPVLGRCPGSPSSGCALADRAAAAAGRSGQTAPIPERSPARDALVPVVLALGGVRVVRGFGWTLVGPRVADGGLLTREVSPRL